MLLSFAVLCNAQVYVPDGIKNTLIILGNSLRSGNEPLELSMPII